MHGNTEDILSPTRDSNHEPPVLLPVESYTDENLAGYDAVKMSPSSGLFF
jgi:hypothetical protein